MIAFVMKPNEKEWPWIGLGLVFSLIAGLEEPASAILFGYAIVAISQPLPDVGAIRSEAGFYSWMFFLLAFVMFIVFGGQGVVLAFVQER